MADIEEEPEEESESSLADTAGKRKRLFHKELRCMMFGFGDDQVPFTESVDLLEDLVVEYITEMVFHKILLEGEEMQVDGSGFIQKTLKAMEVGKKGKVHVEDIVFLIRKDPKKYARVKDLLTMNEELKKARKAFDAESYGEIA